MKETKFKQTEVGMIPSDWEVFELSQLCDKIGDIDHRMPESMENGIPYIMTGDFIGQNELDFEKAKKVSQRDYEQLIKKIKPERGDIIFARYASIGAVRLIKTDTPFLVSYSCAVIKPKKKIDNEYLYFTFFSSYLQEQELLSINVGTQGNVGIDSLKKFLIAIPPSKEEQQRIANTLSDVDTLITNLEELIAKKKNIKQGAMQQLLSGRKRLPGFTGKWSNFVLGQSGYLLKNSINPQFSVTKYFSEYSMPAYDENQKPERVLGSSMHSNRTQISGEVLLFNKLNVRQKRVWYVRKCAENAVCSMEFLPYCSEKIDLQLLRQILLTDEVTSDFIGMSTGTSNSQKRIAPKNFLDYSLRLPLDIREQKAIAKMLVDMDSEIEYLNKKINQYRKLKIGMMQQLLTGKIRLV